MKEKEFKEKVALLRAGKIVEINGNRFLAKTKSSFGGISECSECSLDSLCSGDVTEICMSLTTYARPHWILELVDGKIQ